MMCEFLFNAALKIIYRNLNDAKTKKLLLDLLERLVETTDNDIDNSLLAIVRIKLRMDDNFVGF